MNMMWDRVDRLLELAFEEDVGSGDVTCQATVPEDAMCACAFVARAAGIVSGMEVVARWYARVDARLAFEVICPDGTPFAKGQTLAIIRGPARSVLTGERVALNVMQRMCAVATMASEYVAAVAGTHAVILDTRKTIPGWRELDKMAVRCGGASNHRQGLYDMVLIKDNHIALAGRKVDAESVAWAIREAKRTTSVAVEVEVDTVAQLMEALPEEPDMVLLDNMSPDTMRDAIRQAEALCAERGLRRPLFEASGGITKLTIRAVAESGVDRISVGALTHSVMALDIGLDFLDIN